ncbi:MAG: fasciclin domain-containing protein [Planctomycetota bacterium]
MPKHIPLSLFVACLFFAMPIQLRAETPEEAATIGRRLEGIEKATTFIKLLKNTDKAESLLFAPNGSTTVFVPTNEAFSKLSEARRKVLFDPANKHWLERVLTYHAVHRNRVDNYIIENVNLIQNGLGQYLKVNPQPDGYAKIENAQILEVDLACSNGVVHFIDEVLDPIELDLFEQLEQDGRFTVLTKLIKRSGLTKLFQNRHSTFTVFAPTDSAFQSLPPGTVESLMSPEKLDLLSDVIRTHITASIRTVGKTINAQPLGTPGFDVINEYQQELIFRRENGLATIDGRNILEADIVTRNGIVHIIDSPLLPKRQSLVETLEKAGNYNKFLDLCKVGGVYDFLGQFSTQITVFAPTDEVLNAPETRRLIDQLIDSGNTDFIRGILQRHIINNRKVLLTNAISFQRFTTELGARLDIVRYEDQRAVQGIDIVETDLLARNGVAHGINGIIPFEMELPDEDQNWRSYRSFVQQTIEKGSALFSAGELKKSTQYFAMRNYEFVARYGQEINRLYKIQPSKILNKDRDRNFDYEFATTAWSQRNGFQNLLREIDRKEALLIDEAKLKPMTLKPLAKKQQ